MGGIIHYLTPYLQDAVLGIATGGFAPRQFMTEQGPQPGLLHDRFSLDELSSPQYDDRTRQNIEWADATLVFAASPDSDGTRLTLEYCQSQNKPLLLIATDCSENRNSLTKCITEFTPVVLNVAGNRESVCPGLELKVYRMLYQLWS